MEFQKVENKHPPISVEVIGYNKEWIDEDYNHDGTCVCFLNDDGVWTIAKWCGQHDEWHTRNTDEESGEGTGYESTILPPTHWINKPKFS